MHRNKILTFILYTSALYISDFLTKSIALFHLNDKDIALNIYVHLDLTYNTGAAFSIFADENGWQIYFLSFIAFLAVGYCFLSYIYSKSATFSYYNFSLILISGGALGNLSDRITMGKVIDFISFRFGIFHFPTFNLADIYISLGAIILCLVSISSRAAEDGNEDVHI